MAENATLRVDIIDRIKNILNEHNPFIRTLRHLANRDDIQECKFVIKEQPPNQHNYSMPSASQVAVVVVGGDDIANLKKRDVMVESFTARLVSIKETAGYYDPLQYPRLFPYGSYGWDLNTRSLTGKKITCREFIRICFRVGRLTQQFAVDNYVKMQVSNLRWVALNQDTIRADLYKGLEDLYNAGEHNTKNVGRRTILPSSFAGSPRDMHQRYQDAIALVHKFGKPDIFLTMTCNPSWSKIVAELLPGQQPHDRLDLLTRVFHPRLEELKKDVLERNVLGKNPRSPCMKQGSCKKGFPKSFSNCTKQGNDSYPIYRQRQDAPPVPLRENSQVTVDNRWVVPYNPWLLNKYDCHINVEICSSIKCVKYLYKYIHKGSDRVSMEVHKGDEIAHFVDARWICAPEAMWKFYKFPMTRMNPSVDRLQVDLPNMHQVRF
ncbi:uncharacterized protein LOC104903059 [Beta vulgaris subsp. vulgaris]|uniref:uncharacterized protein LOC104903059 n=1 Tax=Beta vulgaris subsp. vulgaris TaxID=3555 RepID=UPI00254992FF|nr:uncharacterized protein LOC104903059 [Beta vulgaris subsp. vulgaris]